MAKSNRQAAQELAMEDPALEIPVNEDAELEAERDKLQQMANKTSEMTELKRRLAALEAENEQLKKNSVFAPGPYGAGGDYDRVKKACEDAAAKGEDPWQVKISVLAPHGEKGEDSYWLSINGRFMQVPADDRYYELALPFAECLVELIRSRRKSAEFVDKIPNYDPITNPKKMDEKA